jgi:DNA-binding transcriptional regulator YhcF (GntR family)
MTVKRGLKELKDNGVIYKQAHGRKGVSNTIWELAKNMAHVNAWKRKQKGSK